MKLSNIANVVDVEHDNGRLIEIGFTTVNITDRLIVQTYSVPIKVDFELSPEIAALTGWTTAKLRRQGVELPEAARRLLRQGFANRLLVTDQSDEIPFLEKSLGIDLSAHRLNMSILLGLQTGAAINLGLPAMLRLCGLELEGRLHSGADDSRNIARLFVHWLSTQK